jgi:hypothetical protein
MDPVAVARSVIERDVVVVADADLEDGNNDSDPVDPTVGVGGGVYVLVSVHCGVELDVLDGAERVTLAELAALNDDDGVFVVVNMGTPTVAAVPVDGSDAL